ncbi:neutral zinc metallopeptidase [Spirillospora sp. CA-294931]|uniref:neutral zinc metallopeptidase n=1 Tax=Spirillospora sp. CA-294931 TaxID=3240042 RepID=UPI003D8F434D
MTATRTRKRFLAALVLACLPVAGAACDLDPREKLAEATTERPRPSPTRPARTADLTSRDTAEFREDLRTAQSVVDAYWRANWGRHFTGRYRPPRVVGLYDGNDRSSRPRCGDQPLAKNNAVYCPAADYVAWDVSLMRTGYARGDAWVYMVIAHEWGHAIQSRLRRDLVSAAGELQADCLAGAVLYGAAADGTLRFEDGDEQEIVNAFQVIGDRTPWTKPGDHGNATQRLRAFSRGGTGGVGACLIRTEG